MIYHRYYSKPTGWIGLAIREAILKGLNVSAGILVGFMENQEDTLKGFRSAIENEAQGITVFVYLLPKEEMKNG
ncbi:MAG: hypothetical protein B6U94_02180 [Thermofilum sp. ex4484_79]|nr:MAG: hypothetical protein B6U94_02180 [Thermofilum sp. ex4484_79]